MEQQNVGFSIMQKFHDYSPSLLGQCDYPTHHQIKAAMWALMSQQILSVDMRFMPNKDCFQALDDVAETVVGAGEFTGLDMYKPNKEKGWMPYIKARSLHNRGLLSRSCKTKQLSLPFL